MDVFHFLNFTGGSLAGVASGVAKTLRSTNSRSPRFLSGGDTHLKIWTVDTARRTLTDLDVSVGKIRRIITCIEVSHKLCHWRIISIANFTSSSYRLQWDS